MVFVIGILQIIGIRIDCAHQIIPAVAVCDASAGAVGHSADIAAVIGKVQGSGLGADAAQLPAAVMKIGHMAV